MLKIAAVHYDEKSLLLLGGEAFTDIERMVI
jgi:hypothetical protein